MKTSAIRTAVLGTLAMAIAPATFTPTAWANWQWTHYSPGDSSYTIMGALSVAENQTNYSPLGAYVGSHTVNSQTYYNVRIAYPMSQNSQYRVFHSAYSAQGEKDIRYYMITQPSISATSDGDIYVAWGVVNTPGYPNAPRAWFEYCWYNHNTSTWSDPDAITSSENITTNNWDAGIACSIQMQDATHWAIGAGWYEYRSQEEDYILYGHLQVRDGEQLIHFPYVEEEEVLVPVDWSQSGHEEGYTLGMPRYSYHAGVNGATAKVFFAAQWYGTPTVATCTATPSYHNISDASTWKLICCNVNNSAVWYAIYKSTAGTLPVAYQKCDSQGWQSAVSIPYENYDFTLADAAAKPSGDAWDALIHWQVGGDIHVKHYSAGSFSTPDWVTEDEEDSSDSYPVIGASSGGNVVFMYGAGGPVPTIAVE